jgi:O-antigen/teichoic acid export membrane protein
MSLRRHAASLTIVHAAEVLQPLIVLPYAAVMLGPTHFGLYAYAMSIGQLATTVTDFGFHWTAQRAAAAQRDDRAAIASLYAEVTLTKICLMLLVTAFCLAATSADLLSLSYPLLFCTLLAPLGGILFPAWLIIGLECAWRAAVACVVARALALVAFFWFVRSADRVELAVAIQSVIPAVTGLMTLPFVISIGSSGFRFVRMRDVLGQIRAGWRGFLFALVERAVAVLPIPIIEFYAGYAAAGQYALAEKFVGATRPVFRVLLDTLSPRIAYLARHDPAAGIRTICRCSWTLVVGAGISLTLFLFGPMVILSVFGDSFKDSIPILRVLAIVPLLWNVNICTSTLYMFNFGHERAWAGLTVFGLCVFLLFSFALSLGGLEATAAVAAAVIARECVILLVSGAYFILQGLPRLLDAQGLPVLSEAEKAPIR